MAEELLNTVLDDINKNYFVSKCRIPMTELSAMAGLSIDGDLYHKIIDEFYKKIPQEITPTMVKNTLQTIIDTDDVKDNEMTQYISQHNIDTTKRMRSDANTYRILVHLVDGQCKMNKGHRSGCGQALVNVFTPILYHLCYNIIDDYCTD